MYTKSLINLFMFNVIFLGADAMDLDTILGMLWCLHTVQKPLQTAISVHILGLLSWTARVCSYSPR